MVWANSPSGLHRVRKEEKATRQTRCRSRRPERGGRNLNGGQRAPVPGPGLSPDVRLVTSHHMAEARSSAERGEELTCSRIIMPLEATATSASKHHCHLLVLDIPRGTTLYRVYTFPRIALHVTKDPEPNRDRRDIDPCNDPVGHVGKTRVASLSSEHQRVCDGDNMQQ